MTITHDSLDSELGVRFRPTDEQLIHYLIKFVVFNNYVCYDIQFEVLYGSKNSPHSELGVRFRTTYKQLFRYLIKFVASNNYACNDIQFEDLYESKKPWELLEDSLDTKYFFTQLKKLKPHYTKFNRRLIGGEVGKGRSKEPVGVKKVEIKKLINMKKIKRMIWILKGEYDESSPSIVHKKRV
ncbi:hypothetical protein H5410_054174 [Solanum commersonii]|uniref:NAC domain-containing protein n=1 Tax=Solanum commersonii TaxID=4109 RepID=A0A9J5X5W4_SOLCO|nr:hypothetical protein H5410_054174 [Solanum commersonii]